MQNIGHRSPRVVSSSVSLARAARVLVACALFIPAGCDGEADPCEELAAELEATLAARLAAEDRPGGTVATVITPECGLWSAAVGTAGDGKPLTCEHLVRAGSITKTYVSATILSLVAGGSFELDDTLDNWVPKFPDADIITVRQLLDHTSGIFDYTSDEDFLAQILADPTRVYAPEELVAVATAHPPYFAPGDDWYYSNTNYILLGMIVEAVTGEPAAATIRSRVLEPQALAHTFLDGDEPMQGALAHGFDRDGKDVTFALHPSAAWAAGAVAATTGDLAEWALALYGGDVVSPELRDDMLDLIDVSELLPGASYGLGVTAFDASVVGMAHHGPLRSALPAYAGLIMKSGPTRLA